MMKSLMVIFGVVALWGTGLVVVAEDKPSSNLLKPEELKQLIARLGEADARMQDAAQAELVKYGATLLETCRQKRIAAKGTNQALCCLLGPIIKPFADALQEAVKDKNPAIRDRVSQVRRQMLNLTNPKIIFISGAGGVTGTAICLMDITGKVLETYRSNQSGLPEIFPGDSGARDLSVHPEGTKIAFVAGKNNNRDIYVLDMKEKKCRQLTEQQSVNISPAWSPDGTKIAFTSDRDGNEEIYVMDADGQNQKRLTEGKSAAKMPVWRPDGTFIAFISDRDREPAVYTMNPDGKNSHKITALKTDEISAFSMHPDGTKLAFASNRSGRYEIYTAGGMGNDIKQVTKCPPEFEWVGNPVWSPDGTWLAFTVREKGQSQNKVYVVNADGTNIRNVSRNPRTDDTSPAWISSGIEELSALFKD